MKVRFYGKLADHFGNEGEVPVAPPCTVADLRRHLAEAHPQAAELLMNRRVKFCLGDEIVGEDRIVAPDEVVELLAPVSGG